VFFSNGSLHGVVQFLVAHRWDQLWLRNRRRPAQTLSFVGLNLSKIRVWNADYQLPCILYDACCCCSVIKKLYRFPLVSFMAFLLSVAVKCLGRLSFVGCPPLSLLLKARFPAALAHRYLRDGVCIYPLTSIAPFSRFSKFNNSRSFSNIKDAARRSDIMPTS